MAAPPQTQSRFVRLAHVCKAHPWRTFFAWLLALVAIQLVAASVGVKQISNFRLPGTESQRAYDLLAQHFPAAKGDPDQFVCRSRRGALAAPATRARVDAALARVRRGSDVASVQSPYAA